MLLRRRAAQLPAACVACVLSAAFFVPASAILLHGGTALAQTSLHASGSASVGYSDNILNAPTDPGENTDPRVGDVFLLVSPGLMLISELPRARLTLEYQRPVQLFLTQDANESAGDVGNLALAIEASEVDTVILTLTGARTTSYQAASGGTEVQSSLSSEPIDYFGLGASEIWAHQFDDEWSLAQSVTFSSVIPLGQEGAESRGTAGIAGSLTYRLGDNAFILGAEVEGSLLPVSGDLIAAESDDRLPIFTRVTLGYRRDFDENWSADVAGGAIFAVDPLQDERYIGPIWAAGLHWNLESWRASLTYSRDVSPNLVTQETTLTDTIALNGGVPILESQNIALLASSGFSINQDIALDPVVAEPFYTSITDVGIGWLPPDAPQVTVRYVHLEQFGVEQSTGPVQNFYTNQVIATVGWLIPSRPVPLIGRGGNRVDDGDPPVEDVPPEE